MVGFVTHPSMNPAFRRLLALAAVFVTAFIAVSALRTWRSGGDLRSLIPGFSKKAGQFQPEAFTLPDKAPLDLGDVELLSRLNNEYARLTEAVVPSARVALIVVTVRYSSELVSTTSFTSMPRWSASTGAFTYETCSATAFWKKPFRPASLSTETS